MQPRAAERESGSCAAHRRRRGPVCLGGRPQRSCLIPAPSSERSLAKGVVGQATGGVQGRTGPPQRAPGHLLPHTVAWSRPRCRFRGGSRRKHCRPPVPLPPSPRGTGQRPPVGGTLPLLAPKGAYHLWNSRATLGRHLRDPGQGRGLRRVRPEAPCRPSRPADPGPCRAGCRPGFLPAPRWTPASPHAPPVRAERGARGAEPLRSAVQALSAGGGSQGAALALTAAPLGTPGRGHGRGPRGVYTGNARSAAGRQSWAGRANRPEPDAPGAFHGGGGGRSAPSTALRGTAQQHPVPEPLLSPVVGQLSAPLA